MDAKRKLIGLIKDRPVLYNTNLTEYKDIASRNEAWSEIAVEIETSVEECKMEWVKLRNCYVNALRRRVNLQSRVGKTLPPWVYETEMKFIKPFMSGRAADDTPYTVLLPDYTMDQEESNDETKRRKPKSPKLEVYDDTYEIVDNTFNECGNGSTSKVTKSYQDIISDIDESDLFFLSLSQTFKKLPKLEQCKLKMDIFKIVNDAEMKHLEGLKKRKRRSSTE